MAISPALLKYKMMFKSGGKTPSEKKHVDFYKNLEKARRAGQGQDKVLAHINPEEADHLQKRGGMSVNPVTGLPQFGALTAVADLSGNPPAMIFARVAETLLDMIPEDPGHSPLEAEQLRRTYGNLEERARMSEMTPAELEAFYQEHGYINPFVNYGQPVPYDPVSQGPSQVYSEFDPLALEGEGQWRETPKIPRGQPIQQMPFEEDPMAMVPFPAMPTEDKLGILNAPFTLPFGEEYIDEEEEEEGPEGFPVYKEGGYIKGSDGGTDDNVPMDIPEGAFVFNATDVSLLGDGNTENGIQKIKQLEKRYSKDDGNIVNVTRPQGYIKAKVSHGEHIVHPGIVNAIGGGDNSKGAKILNDFRKQLRKEKGVRKVVLPKTKPIMKYISKSRKKIGGPV